MRSPVGSDSRRSNTRRASRSRNHARFFWLALLGLGASVVLASVLASTPQRKSTTPQTSRQPVIQQLARVWDENGCFIEHSEI